MSACVSNLHWSGWHGTVMSLLYMCKEVSKTWTLKPVSQREPLNLCTAQCHILVLSNLNIWNLNLWRDTKQDCDTCDTWQCYPVKRKIFWTRGLSRLMEDIFEITIMVTSRTQLRGWVEDKICLKFWSYISKLS